MLVRAARLAAAARLPACTHVPVWRWQPQRHVWSFLGGSKEQPARPQPRTQQKATVYAWGNGNEGQCGIGDCVSYAAPQGVPALNGRSVVTVGSGVAHSVAIVEAQIERGSGRGNLYAWGSNAFSQVGGEHVFNARATDEAEDEQSMPLMLPGLGGVRFSQCGAGYFHNVALGHPVDAPSSQYGSVYTWGAGLLGHGSDFFDGRPQIIKRLEHSCVTHVAAGGYHTVACTPTQVFVWGWLTAGPGSHLKLTDPVALSFFNDRSTTHAACGLWHTCLLTQTNDNRQEIYVFGVADAPAGDRPYCPFYDALSPQVLDDHEAEDIAAGLTPRYVPMGGVKGSVVAVGAGVAYTAILTDKGGLYAFGTNKAVCGDGSSEPVAVEMPNGEPVRSMGCGPHRIVAVTQSGDVVMWGNAHSFGPSFNKPTLLRQGLGVARASAGYDFTVLY